MKCFLLNCITLCVVPVLGLSQTAAAQTGPEILARTDVTGGLIVHLGCGTGEGTASLCINRSYKVHGQSGGRG